jgi:hypothetical protein
MQLVRSLPLHVCAIHQCFDDLKVRTIINFFLRFLSDQDRARVKLHHGSHMEVVYALMTYGIPTDLLPVNSTGSLKRKNHLEWLKIRQWQEDHPESPRIVVPLHSDILFGRGKPFRQHLGNLHLGNRVEERLAMYMAAQTKEKTRIIEEVVDQVIAEGGRFLKQDGPGTPWLQVSHQQAKEKTSQSFRTRARYAAASGSETQRGPSDDGRNNRRAFDDSGENSSVAASVSPLSTPLSLPEETSSADYHTMTAGYRDTKRRRF